MFLFKTSRATYRSVIQNQKHAFGGQPKDWEVGERVLVSKNRADCRPGERQIQHVMRLANIRLLRPGESGTYWPGTEGRWKYLFECSDTEPLSKPFNLAEVLGSDADQYLSVMTYKRLTPEHERKVEDYLSRI
jgi:hypothetical protein